MSQTFPWKSKFTLLAGAVMLCIGIFALSGQAASDFMIVKPVANNSYLANPGIGWQYMIGNTPYILSETVAYPNRADISWSILNPGRGVYDWRALDNQINSAVAAGKQASFRIYTMRGESWGGHQMPQWVVNTGGVLLSSGEPDYSSCNYQENWATFVQALRQRYDGNVNVAYIDISGYGNFNEWSWHDQTEFDNNALAPASLDGKARRRLADIFIGGSSSSHQCRGSNGQTQTISYSYPGFQTSQLVMPYAGIRQSTEYVTSRRTDVGIRFDCLGRNGNSTAEIMNRIGTQIESTWRSAPIIFELCSGINTADAHFNDVQSLLRRAHGSLVHDNSPGSPRQASRMEDLMRNVGYRYQLSEASYSRSVSAGTSLNLSMIWQNIGYAPSYPRMGQRFTLQAYLVDANNNIVAQQAANTGIEQWLPASNLPGTPPNNLVNVALPVPANAQGTYNVRVAIVDQRTQRPINLAISGRDSRGLYLLGELIVGSVGAAPTLQPVNPTATQVLPTATQIVPTATIIAPESTVVNPPPVQASATPQPAQNLPPVMGSIPDQTGSAGSAVALQISATDPENRPLRFTADGLPAGTSINPGNGAISGTLQSAGQTVVTVRAIDDAGQNATISLRWTINAAPGGPIAPPVSAPITMLVRGDRSDNATTEFTYRLTNTGDGNLSGLSVRVYFTLEPGFSINDYVLQAYWDQSRSARISGPTSVSGDLYYYTISYGSANLLSNRTWEWFGSMHLRNWGSGMITDNDYWRQGSYSNQFSPTLTLPVYMNNALALGTEPNGTSAPVVQPPVVQPPVVIPPAQPPVVQPPANQPPVVIPPAQPQNPGPVNPPANSANLSVSLRAGTDKNNSTDFRYQLNNLGTSAQNNLSVRIYFTPDNGRPASDYMMETYWDSVGGASLSGPFQGSGSHHYFVVSYGGRELSAGANWIWDGVLRTRDWSSGQVSSNDWWTQGGFSTTLSSSSNIPVYASEALIAGRQP